MPKNCTSLSFRQRRFIHFNTFCFHCKGYASRNCYDAGFSSHPLIEGVFWDTFSDILQTDSEKEVPKMYGYPTDDGYMGNVNGEYMLFASDEEYRDYLEDSEI